MRNYLFPKSLLLLLLSLGAFSCSKDDDQPIIAKPITIQPELFNYRTLYMDYPNSVMPNQNQPKNIVKLEYNAAGQVEKRWGNLLPVNWATGYDYYFSEGIFEEVTYQGNQITITKKDTLNAINVYPDHKFILLDGGKMVRFIKEKTTFTTTRDTTYLYYTSDKLTRTVNKTGNSFHFKNFYYNTAGNLTETKGVNINRYSSDTISFHIETFGNFDQASNPVRQLGMFDELFLRSLSTNNFRQYTSHRYSKDSTMVSKETKNWNLKYDAAGSVKFEE